MRRAFATLAAAVALTAVLADQAPADPASDAAAVEAFMADLERAEAAEVVVGQPFVGLAIALDGDTLRVGPETRVRLWGIDAAEMSDWPRGAHARAALDQLLAGAFDPLLDGVPLVCYAIDRDRYGRIIARCGAGAAGDDLGQLMLRAGYAVVYRRYAYGAGEQHDAVARDYDAAERAARDDRLGVWADWRPPATD